MVTYVYYKEIHKGKLDEITFNELLPRVNDLTLTLVNSLVQQFNMKESLEEFDINFSKPICYSLDFMDSTGGVDTLNGISELDISTVETDGFTFGKSGKGSSSTGDISLPMINGIYISPIAYQEIWNKLLIKGLLYRGIR